jgi:hypothetical protein
MESIAEFMFSFGKLLASSLQFGSCRAKRALVEPFRAGTARTVGPVESMSARRDKLGGAR